MLSAAHCFTSIKSSDLLAGVHDITLEYPQYEFSILPTDVTRHPSYNAALHANDIAIVSTIRSPFRFTSSIQAIIMAPRSFINTNLTGTTARVAGWYNIQIILRYIFWFVKNEFLGDLQEMEEICHQFQDSLIHQL